MSEPLSRRTFLGLASATLLVAGTLETPVFARGIHSWSLTPRIVLAGDPLHFLLQVSYSIDTVEDEELFVQVADAEDATIFFDWEPILSPTGDVFFEIGPYDVPDDRAYVVSIVTGDGETHPLSPDVSPIDVEFTPARIDS